MKYETRLSPWGRWKTTGVGLLSGMMLGTPVIAQENLLQNGSFESGLTGWTTSGNVLIQGDAWDGSSSVRLLPQSNETAQLSQRVTGLEPRGRYTIAARIRTSDPLSPPILGIRDGAQIAKAYGWVAIDDADLWLERRFEVHLEEDSDRIRGLSSGLADRSGRRGGIRRHMSLGRPATTTDGGSW